MLRSKRIIIKTTCLFAVFILAGFLSKEAIISSGEDAVIGPYNSRTTDSTIFINGTNVATDKETLENDQDTSGNLDVKTNAGSVSNNGDNKNDSKNGNGIITKTESGLAGKDQISLESQALGDKMPSGETGDPVQVQDASAESGQQTDDSEDNPVPGFVPKIEDCEINIPGMKDEFRFLYLADNHIIVTGNSDTQRILDNESPRIADFTDHDSGFKSAEEFSKWVDYANALKVNGVLIGGDLVDCPSQENISFIRDNLGRLHMPYLYALGNHDWTFPWEYFTTTAQTQYKPLFNEFMNQNTEAGMMEYDDFVIVSVDDSENQINPGAFNTLTTAFEKKKPIIILMHVPLETPSVSDKSKTAWGSDISIGLNGIKPNEDTTKFINMIYGTDSPVVAVLAGHVHFADTSQLGDKNIQYIVGPGYEGNGIMLTIKGN